ncbi:MAG TPA: helix-turn-helix transcriptional regulator [Kineosporiaceae bacterium]|nr:helix-turn-helix transcriptional regulator [Kineosporiaceae bacterium]
MGISSEYYTRLERGDATGASESIIEAIAQALQLDEAERIHLLDLLHGAGATRPPSQANVRELLSTYWPGGPPPTTTLSTHPPMTPSRPRHPTNRPAPPWCQGA